MSEKVSISSYVCELDELQSAKLHDILADRGWEFSEIPHARWQARRNKTSIASFKSGKLTVQGRDTSEFVTFVLEPEILGKFGFGYENIDKETGELIPFIPHAGVDESGKGDFFGPLVISAAFVDNDETAELLVKAGTRDSKKISIGRIPKIASEIRKIIAGKFAVVQIGPDAYNKLYNSIGNLNRLLAWGHARAIENLLDRVPNCAHALSDKFGNENLIQRALLEKGRKIMLEQRTKAESDIAVAAASILARDIFLAKMQELSAAAGIELPRGGGSDAVKAAAAELAAKIGSDKMGGFVKLHFSTALQFKT